MNRPDEAPSEVSPGSSAAPDAAGVRPAPDAIGPLGRGSEEQLRLLIVEDSMVDARLIGELLRGSSHAHRITATHVSTLEAAERALGSDRYDCVLVDLGLPDGRGVENVTALRAAGSDATIVVLTGFDDEPTAIEALRRGAQEYVIKGNYSSESLVRLVFHAVQRDRLVRELVVLRESAQWSSTHDGLTGLPNRALFMDRARQAREQAVRQCACFQICYFDLDGFKGVNDTYGHAVGDQVLRSVAASLQAGIRSADTVARIGGDEFVALLGIGTTPQEGRRIVRRLIRNVEAITRVQDHTIRISMSAGMAGFPDVADDVESLIARADRAMYAAKRRGPGAMRYSRRRR